MTRLRAALAVLLLGSPLTSLIPVAPGQAPPELPDGSPWPLLTGGSDAAVLTAGFDAGTLEGEGWSVERLHGAGPGWTRVTDAAAHTGFAFEGGAAALALDAGGYPLGLDARLRSPTLDLRWLPGAPAPPVAAPWVPAADETLRLAANATAALLGDLGATPGIDLGLDPSAPGSARAGLAPSEALQGAGLWPPSAAEALGLGEPPVPAAGLAGPAPPGALAKVHLLLRHAWDFAPGDGGFLEARAHDGSGAWGPWQRLTPSIPWDAAVHVGDVLPAQRGLTYNGALGSGEGAFIGTSSAAETVVPLEGFVGQIVQLAFRVRTAAPVPPQSFGWALDRVEVRAALGGPDVAVDGFHTLHEGAALALGASFVPDAVVRNWGAWPTGALVVVLDARARNASLPGYPANLSLAPLAPGEARRVSFPQPLRSATPVGIELVANLSGPRVDLRPENDAARVRLAIADQPGPALRLEQPRDSVVTEARAPKAFTVLVTNLGNVAPPGRLALVVRTPGAAWREVAGIPFTPPAPAGPLTGGPAPVRDEARAELRWTPGEADRGAFEVQARWIHGTAVAASTPLRTYVDDSLPALLDEAFGPGRDDTRPQPAGSASRLDGWAFDAWAFRDGNVSRLPPDPPSPSRMLAARAEDGVGTELGRLAGVGRRVDRLAGGIEVSLPPEVKVPGVGASHPVEAHTTPVALSAARLLLAAEPVLCSGAALGRNGRMPHLYCHDPGDEVDAVPLRELLDSAVWSEGLQAGAGSVHLEVDGARIRAGDAEGEALFVVLNTTVDPGLDLWLGALVLHLAGQDTPLVAGGWIRPYQDGTARCCVIGPLRAADLLAPPGPPSSALSLLPDLAAPPALGSTMLLQRYTATRDLQDLLDQAGNGSSAVALAFEHRAALNWADGRGVRGVIELVNITGLPLVRREVSTPTRGWAPVLLPFDPAYLGGPLRLVLTLERVAGDNLTGAFPGCPYLDPAADCSQAPAWWVDDLRLLVAAGDGWRVAARDPLEDPDAAFRWTGDLPPAGAPSTGVAPRGWAFERADRAAPHRWHLAEQAGSATRALRWGEPGSPASATSEAQWSVARTPWLDLAGLAAPTATFRTRYDFGAAEGGRMLAGGAVVAALAEPGGVERRVLLRPMAGPGEGAVYRGDVDAAAFAGLARALRVEVPRGAGSTAFTGASGVPFEEAAEPAWVRVEVDLRPLLDAPTGTLVALEFHSVAAAPLRALGWLLDDLRIGERGPGRDLALAGVAEPPDGAEVALGEPVPLALAVENRGLFRARGAQVELVVRDAAGRQVHPAGDAPMVVPLPDAGPGAPPGPGDDAALVAFPTPWVPAAPGTFRVEARVRTAAGDEVPANDLAVAGVGVRNLAAAALDVPAEGLVVAGAAGATVDTPLGLQVAVENRGTQRFDAQRPLRLRLDVADASGDSVLGAPLVVDVPALLGRPLMPRERAVVALPAAWVPAFSGVYRAIVDIATEGVAVPGAGQAAQTFVVTEALARPEAAAFAPSGGGWTNATRGAPPSLWTWAPGEAGGTGALTLREPLDLTPAKQAQVVLTHRHTLEEGFDGARLEVSLDNATWHPVPPLEDAAWGTLHPPNPLAWPRERGPTPAFTGTAADRRTTFDLAAVPVLRERFPLAATGPPGDALGAAPEPLAFAPAWLGPSPVAEAVWYAGPAPAPTGGAADAVAHVRRDQLAYPLTLPEGEGEVRVRYLGWHLLGLSGAAETPPSAARVTLQSADGAVRLEDAAGDDGAANVARDWALREAVFPTAGRDLGGRAALLVFEHREVHARVPGGLASEGRTMPAFASDAVSPHGGFAVANPSARVVRAGSEADLPLEAALPGSAGAWLQPGQDLPSGLGPFNGLGFAPLVPAEVWSSEGGGWRASAAQGFPDARLVAALDLTPAVANVTLTLRESRHLALLQDAATGARGAASAVGVEVSRDAGATWIPVPPLASARATVASLFSIDGSPLASRHSTFAGSDADPEGDSVFGPGGEAVGGEAGEVGSVRYDLSAFAGQPVLLALHASFGTAPYARGDWWHVEGARVEGDVLRGAPVHLRLRAGADGTGPQPSWDIVALEPRVVRHDEGLGVRLLQPAPGPILAGFHVLEAEVVNRGGQPQPPQTLRLAIQEPAEQGGRLRTAVREVPALGPGQRATIQVRGVDINWALAAGLPPVVVTLALEGRRADALALDDRVVAELGGAEVQPRTELVPERVEVLPQVVDLTDPQRKPVSIVMLARNGGSEPATLAPSVGEVRRELLPGEDPLAAAARAPLKLLNDPRPAVARVEPGDAVSVTWSWRPGEFAPPGAHTVVAKAQTGSASSGVVSHRNATLILGGPFLGELAYAEPFGATADQQATRPGWSCVSAAPCAFEDATVARSAPVSLALAPPGAGSGRVLVEGPVFPAAMLPDPVLAVHVRHDLPPGEEVRVLVASAYAGGVRGPFEVVAGLQGRTAGFAEGRFVEARAALARNATGPPGAGDFVGFAVRFDVPGADGALPSFWLDDISITPLDAAIAAPPTPVLGDAVTKRLRFEVRNAGNLSDAYQLRFATERGPAVLPRGWQARLEDPATGALLATSADPNLTSPLAVGGGVARAVDLVLTVPPSAGASPLRGQVRVPLLLQSTLLPALTRAAVALLDARGEPRPDLAVLDVRVRSPEEPVGRTRAVEVAVANRGLAPATAALEVQVEPPRGFAEAPERLRSAGPGGPTLVTLPPGAVRTVLMSWTPRHAGEHVLAAALDPDRAVLEAAREDNLLERRATVPPLPFPDLHVTLALGEAEALAGATGEVRVAVRNAGPVPARGVEVEVRAGVASLVEDPPLRIGEVAPGETWNLTLAWTPEVPGNTSVVATAFAREGAPEPVATLGDNAALAAVRVREETSRVRALAANLTLDPEVALEVPFRILNAGNAEERYTLRPEVPEGWAATVAAEGRQTARLSVPAGGSAGAVLRVLPPPGATAGTASVALVAVPDSSGRAHRGVAPVQVPPVERVVVDLAGVEVQPSDPAIVLDVTNLGNAPARLQARGAVLPEGWTLLGAVGEVPAGARQRVRLALDLGPADAPRSVPFRLDWAAGNLTGRLGGALRVLPEVRLQATAHANATAGGEGVAVVELRNVGNAPFEGVARLAAPEGFSLPAHEALAVPAHGATRVQAPLSAAVDAPAEADLAVRLEDATGTRAELTVPVQLAAADLALEVAPRPRGLAVGTEARWVVAVANRGTAVLRGVAAELYVDGALVQAMPLGDLPPGAVADASLAWTVAGGAHTVTILAAHQGGLVDVAPDDNAFVETLHADDALAGAMSGLRSLPAPGAPWLLPGLLAAALLAARRRREA